MNTEKKNKLATELLQHDKGKDRMNIQMDFTNDNSEIGLLKQEISAVRMSLDRQRRKQFSLLSGFGKSLVELKSEIASMKDSKIVRINVCDDGDMFSNDRGSASVCVGSNIGSIFSAEGA